MPIKLDIVTAEKLVYSDDVDAVIAPGIEGELGILPHHANLMTMLAPGELRIRRAGEEISMAISGGFLEVRPDKIVVLADAAERDTEIDFSRAEEAKRRAQERLARHVPGIDVARAEAALQRSIARLKVADKRRRRRLGA
ncbi:MAG TPA: F0F1 ATP synthase subunit epsilon [Dehalococcoidales bacterium]|nr:F0F1 ATP synthase subunit epsilon [Dehalococcoidales bacterium]